MIEDYVVCRVLRNLDVCHGINDLTFSTVKMLIEGLPAKIEGSRDAAAFIACLYKRGGA